MIATKLFENGRYLTLLVLSVIAVGLTSFNGMARQEDPSITPFVAAITTYFPGASPARMETLISKPNTRLGHTIPTLAANASWAAVASAKT